MGTRKKLYILAVAAAFIAPALWLWQGYTVVENILYNTLGSYGFYNPAIKSTSLRPHELVYDDIRLDEEGFSTIRTISMPVSLSDIFLRRSLSHINIEGVRLTGEYNRENGLIIEGWTPRPVSPAGLQEFVLDDAYLDLMTGIGALRFHARGHIERRDNKSAELLGALWGVQHQVRLDSIWKGTFHENGQWDYHGDIHNAAFNLDRFQASRISGWIGIKKESEGFPGLSGQLVAGMVNIGTLHLNDLSLKIDGRIDKHDVRLDARIAGFDDMHATLESRNTRDGLIVSAKIENNDIRNIVGFLELIQQNLGGTALDSGILTTLMLTPGNLNRIERNISEIGYDNLVLEIGGPLYELSGKITAEMRSDGTVQRQIISLDPIHQPR